MATDRNVLTDSEKRQLWDLLRARFPDFVARKLSKKQAIQELMDHLAFDIGRANFDTALQACGLQWPAPELALATKKKVLQPSYLCDVLCREHLRICERLNIEPSARIRDYCQQRREQRKGVTNKDAANASLFGDNQNKEEKPCP